MRTQSTKKPDTIEIGELVNGLRNVALRERIEENRVNDSNGNVSVFYTYDEACVSIEERDNMYFYILANFNDLLKKGTVSTTQENSAASTTPTLEERIASLENAINTLMEV